MDSTKRYKVTCLKCGESDVVTINDADHQVWDYAKKMLTNIMAMRWRKDLQWGFECRCGNDNRLAQLEKDDFDQLVQGDPISINRIAKSLQIDDKSQFRMERA